tara:strand:- start:325 stop:552 length:228 start_codon:yes stop_codon:yes gene_type:complete
MSTKISIATTKNTVTVNGETKVVSVVTAGAQGAKGIELDETGRVDRSLIYYDQTAQTYKSNATVTTSELTDGGNF